MSTKNYVTTWDVAKAFGHLHKVPGKDDFPPQRFYVIKYRGKFYSLVEDDYLEKMDHDPSKDGIIITRSRFVEAAQPGDMLSADENELRQVVLALKKRALRRWRQRKRDKLRVYWRGDQKIIDY